MNRNVADLRPETAGRLNHYALRPTRLETTVEFMHYSRTKWATYLLSLKSFVEKGKGKPYPNHMDID
jgi:hypothetical protein